MSSDLLVGTILGVSLIAAAAWMIPKLVLAAGIAFGVAAGTVATSVSPWVAPVAATGLGLTGGALVVQLLVKAGKEASKDPYDWTVAVLALVAGFMIDVAKEYAFDNVVLRLALGTVIAFLVVVAGALYKRGGGLWRSVAVMLILLPPLAILGRNLSATGLGALTTDLKNVPTSTWVRLGLFVLVGSSLAILHNLTTRNQTLKR